MSAPPARWLATGLEDAALAAFAEGRAAAPAFLPDRELAFRATQRGEAAAVALARRGQLVAGALLELDPHLEDTLARSARKAKLRLAPCAVVEPSGAWGAARTVEHALAGEGFAPPERERIERARALLERLELPAAGVDAAARGEPAPWLCPRLFVYGTLLPGEANERRLAPGRPRGAIGAAVAGARLLDLGAFPGMRLDADPASRVRGLLLELEDMDALFGGLDPFEGCRAPGDAANLFERALCTCDTAAGPMLAWTYWLARDPAGVHPLPGGDWLARG